MNIRNLFPAALALLLCAVMLAGCAAPKDAVTSDPPADSTPAAPGSSGPSKPVDPEPAAPTEDKLSFPAQLQLIADNVKQWALTPDFADDRTGYAVTDLDNNGQLELIAANQGGTGHYTYAAFYEVNPDGTALESPAYDFPEGSSQPDLMDTDPIPLFWCGTSGAFTYIFRDWLKATAAEYYESLWALTLQDGAITTEPLGTKETVYGDNGETVRYTDSKGNSITAAEYEKLAAAAYPDCKQAASAIHWLMFNRDASILALDADTLLKQLTESLSSSGITDGLNPTA